jgi:hypothetical protein
LKILLLSSSLFIVVILFLQQEAMGSQSINSHITTTTTTTAAMTVATIDENDNKNTNNVMTVRPTRKQELLLQARQERLSYIQASSFPFQILSSSTFLERAKEDEEENQDQTQHGHNGNGDLNSIYDICNSVHLRSGALPKLMELLLSKEQSSSSLSTPSLKEMSHEWKAKYNSIVKKHDYNALKHGTSTISSASSTSTSTSTTTSSISSTLDLSKEQNEIMIKTNDYSFIFFYQEILNTFCKPECSDIIQAIKHFEYNLHEFTSSSSSSSSLSKQSLSVEEKYKCEYLNKVASFVQKHITKLYESLGNHPFWIRNNGSVLTDEMKMMIETFCYTKVFRMIQPLLSKVIIYNDVDDHVNGDENDNDNGNSGNINEQQQEESNDVSKRSKEIPMTLQDEEKQMKKRLNFLQFVEPKHLDMHSIVPTNDNNNDGNMEETAKETSSSSSSSLWQTQLDLSKPISNLQSLEIMYSPSQILRCILEIYRGVNEALRKCLQSQNNDTVTTANVSADDVLPSLILTVIHANPNNIMTTLKFLDIFCYPNQRRGEAEYAFTQLYSAVQFVKALDLPLLDDYNHIGDMIDHRDNNGDNTTGSRSGKPTLSLSEDVLQAKLCEFRAQMPKTSNNIEKVASVDQDTSASDTHSNDIQKGEYAESSFHRIEIPIMEIKAARLRGEDVKEWATHWVQEQNLVQCHTTETGESTGQTSTNCAPSPLNSFSRSYKFLGTAPEDVKVSDIAQLLEEYKMLVRTTETLIMERQNFGASTQQKAIEAKRRVLEHSLEEVMKTGKDSLHK